jgi:hypothetical protein
MSKKKPSSTSAGTTVNPAAQPTAPAAAAPAAPAPARAKAKTTAGPAETPATDAADFEQEASAFLQESINIGSDAEDLELDAALAGKANRANPAADTTPVADDAPAEDQTSGEDTAATEATGDTPEQDDSANNDETDDSDDPETPAAETEAETETDTEVDDEAVKWPKSYLRRINKLTEKIERLEEQANEAAQLREENDRLKANPAPDGLGSSSAAVTSEEQTLQQQLAKVEETLDFIEAHPEGATIGERQWSPEELRQQKRAYERKMRELEAGLVDAKRRRAERAEALGQRLAERHPWMKDRKHPGYARVEEIVRMYPAFRDIPEARTMIADHLAFQGLLDRMAKQGANGNGNGTANGHANGKPAANGNGHKPAPPPPRPPARGPGKPAATPMPVNGRRASLQQAESRFLDSGDHEAGKTLISSLLGDD